MRQRTGIKARTVFGKFLLTGFLIFFLLAGFCQVQAQRIFTSFDDFLLYAQEKSLTLKNGNIQFTQAKKARLAAQLGILDPSGSVSGTYTNNTRLPVNLFPAEILGGEPGTYQEVKLGVQYVTNLNTYAEIKLLNVQGWEQLNLSKINLQVTEAGNKLYRKQLYEDIASVYFNIVTLQAQLQATGQNLLAADTLYQNAQSRFNQGQVRQQDVNDARVNYLQTQESVNQIRFQITRQYNALKILCDIPEEEYFQIEQVLPAEIETEMPAINPNALSLNQALYQEQYARSNYRQTFYSNFPTLSFFLSGTRQQFNTSARLFDNNVNWIPSSYIGLRLSIPLPTASFLSRLSQTRYDYLLAQNRTAQARITTTLNLRNLETDYQKAASEYKSYQQMYGLRRDSYQKNLLNYRQGITSLDQTLNSFNAMVNSNYELISSAIGIWLAEAKINIHNTIQ